MTPQSKFKYLPAHVVESIHDLQITLHRPLRGTKEGIHKSSDYGSSIEFADYRYYTPGDSPKRIDWSLFARTDRYLIRQSREETSLTATIMVDCSASQDYKGAGELTKFEYSCYLAAALMYILVAQGDSASLVTFSDKIHDVFPPTSVTQGLFDPLTHLESVKPSGEGKIGGSLMSVSKLLKMRGLVICITDCLDKTENITKAIQALSADGQTVVIVHVMDDYELNIPYTGVCNLRDMETDKQITVNMDDLQGEYKTALNVHSEKLSDAAHETYGRYFRVKTSMGIAEALSMLWRNE